MSHLPNTITTPPGGWRYYVPETQKLIKGPNLQGLIQNIRSHLQGTGYSLPHDIAARIEAWMCDQPELREYCGNVGHSAIPKAAPAGLAGLTHTFHAALNCVKTLASHRAGGGQRPSKELAEARASVCAQCPKNSDIAPCSVCSLSPLRAMIEKLVGGGKTSRDEQLKFCSVCHCHNRAKVQTMHAAIWNFMPARQKEELPPECWILTEAAKEK